MSSTQFSTAVRALLVDDSLALRDAIRRLLSKSRSVQICGEATNGYEALEQATQLKPEVIIMDIGMPVMDGLEATRRLRRASPAIEILIFTEHDSEHAVNAAWEAGARGYLHKAVAAAELERAVETVARHESYCAARAATASAEGPHPA
jgi:DNA-binding NarL/FixJ family response regulator